MYGMKKKTRKSSEAEAREMQHQQDVATVRKLSRRIRVLLDHGNISLAQYLAQVRNDVREQLTQV